MKFFKKELWARINSDDENEREQANAEWDQNNAAYYEHLKQLRPRLPVNASRFFGKISLHDGTLLSISLGDAIDSTEEIPLRKRKTRIRMIVAFLDNPETYILQYSGIRQIFIDFPSATPLFYDLGDSFGYWGYDELTDAGDGFLRHEVLFDSGATIAIEFKHFKYNKKLKKKSNVK